METYTKNAQTIIIDFFLFGNNLDTLQDKLDNKMYLMAVLLKKWSDEKIQEIGAFPFSPEFCLWELDPSIDYQAELKAWGYKELTEKLTDKILTQLTSK